VKAAAGAVGVGPFVAPAPAAESVVGEGVAVVDEEPVASADPLDEGLHPARKIQRQAAR
jgi:hypothetical protein